MRGLYIVRINCILLLMLFLFQGNAISQDDTTSIFLPLYDTIPNRFGLFERDELLEITLSFDITYFMKNKPEEEYIDALLTYHFNDFDSINKPVRLRARGNYRHRTCPFPPIRFNLENSSLGYSDLTEIKNLKLVSHCRQTKLYEDYMLKEYLIYKLYNIVSDFSFRVRLLKVNYIDLGKRESEITRYAFLIEPVESLEERTNSVEVENVTVSMKNLEEPWADKVGLFQFMIGNSDWYLPTLHNLNVFNMYGVPDPRLVVVPYDFDYSGFVNTEYAVARDDLNLTDIRERAYIGPCRDKREWNTLLDEFEGYRDQFIETIREFPYLDREIRRDLIDYINSFYSLYRRDAIIDIMKLNCVDINK